MKIIQYNNDTPSKYTRHTQQVYFLRIPGILSTDEPGYNDNKKVNKTRTHFLF